ncbi:MAG: NAD(P)H-dependent glycerol-3-phosphate dehydrogenase [Tepidisphaeraceae bacterium]
MPEKITILGDGAMGTVCSILVNAGGHHATMWGAFEDSIERLLQNRENTRLLPGVRVPENVHLTANERDCFVGSTMVISAIPTQHLRKTWTRLAPHLPAGVPVVSVGKGIEIDTLQRPTQVIANVLKEFGKPASVAVLSGPNIAAELAKYQPGSAVAACPDGAIAERVQQVMTTQWFRVYRNTDVIGVEIAGATKNIIALAAGMLDGMRAGNNAKATLVTRGLVEISRLGVAMGAQPSTFQGLAGLGDLITTCVSPEGRNRSVGEQLGRGVKLDDVLANMRSVAEGVPTARAVHQLSQKYGVEMPISEQVYQILFEGKDVMRALSDLMTRELKSEG